MLTTQEPNAAFWQAMGEHLTGGNSTPPETWLPIPGFPGYEVSDLGQVKSHKGRRPRILKSSKDRKGYLGVALGNANLYKRVHALVMLAFVGPRPEGLEICHRDGNPGNNCLSNLRYDTPQANMQDALRAGVQMGKPKLTTSQVVEIRRLRKEGWEASSLAKRYDVTVSTINNAIAGRGRCYSLSVVGESNVNRKTA